MKLTIATLALLVAGTSYADMAAASKCFYGSKAQKECDKYVAKHLGMKCEVSESGIFPAPYCTVPNVGPPAPPVPPTPHDGCFHGAKAKKECDKYVAKHLGMKCEATGFGKHVDYCPVRFPGPPAPPVPPTPHDGCFYGSKAQKECDQYVAKHLGMKCEVSESEIFPAPYCPVPNVGPPAPIPSPPTPSVKVDDLPLYKATQSDLQLRSCQYKTKHGINQSAKCTGVDKHEGGLEINVQYQAKNLDKPEKLQEEVKFHGKAKSDGDPHIPLEVHAGGKIKMKGDSIKGEGKEKVVPNDGGAKQEVTYRCTGNKDSVHCEWSA